MGRKKPVKKGSGDKPFIPLANPEIDIKDIGLQTAIEEISVTKDYGTKPSILGDQQNKKKEQTRAQASKDRKDELEEGSKKYKEEIKGLKEERDKLLEESLKYLEEKTNLEKERDEFTKEKVKLEEEIQKLQKQLNSTDIKQFQTKIQTLQSENQKQIQIRDKYESECAILRNDKKALEIRHNQLLEERIEKINTIYQLQGDLLEQGSKLTVVEERMEALFEKANSSDEERLKLDNERQQKVIEVRNNKLEEYEKEIDNYKRQVQRYADSGLEILDKKNRELKEELRNVGAELNRLREHQDLIDWYRQNRHRAEELQNKNEHLQREKQTLYDKLEGIQEQLAEFNVMKLERDRLEDVNNNLETKLEEYRKMLETQRGDNSSAFRKLISLIPRGDREEAGNGYPGDQKIVSLVQEAADKCNFKYKKELLRSFMAALRSTRFIILKGFSGTGKSSLPQIFARVLGGECEVIPVQPSWRSKVDLMGFYNHFDHVFMPTIFTEALFKAGLKKNSDRFYFILLDEMNLARVEYYFSDFNSKLQASQEEQVVDLFDGAFEVSTDTSAKLKTYLKDGRYIRIPQNVFFIGTINDDESVQSISDKIYDRAQVLDFSDNLENGNGNLSLLQDDYPQLSFSKYIQTGYRLEDNKDINKIITDLIENLNELVLKDNFNTAIAPRTGSQILEAVLAYQSAGGSTGEGLDWALTSKLLPKIKYSHMENFEKNIDNLKQEIGDNWPTAWTRPDQILKCLETKKRLLV